MSDFIFVYLVFANEKQAETIGINLVESGVIACINILPSITSIYSWENKIHKNSETAAFLKTTKEMYEQVEVRIKSLHSYNTPCILAMDVSLGNKDFLNWITEQMN